MVEDSALVSAALRVLFEASGHRVSVAGSVADAVAVGTADHADLVLADLALPDGSGLTVVRQLSALPGRTVFVALTGYDEPERRAECLAAGCVDVLVKPVPVRDLVRRINAWLDGL